MELVNPLGYQYKSLSLQISFQKSLRLREEMHFSSSKQSLLCNRTWFFDRINGTIWPQSSWKYCSSQVNTLLKAWRHFPARFSLLQNAAVKVLAKFLCSPWNPIEKRCHSNYCINRIWACILLEEFNHFLFWGRSLWIQFSAPLSNAAEVYAANSLCFNTNFICKRIDICSLTFPPDHIA